jgi:CO/xanthine dehydrogenase Mo-binding subunit
MQVVGQNLYRVDGYEKVTGKTAYTADLRIPGMAHAKVLRCSLPHARIRKIDSHKAESVPGVLTVLTRENLPDVTPYFGRDFKDQPVVAIEKVRYDGDIVAAVVATDDTIADEALNLIDVDYEELPAVVTLEEALEEGAPLVHERRGERGHIYYGGKEPQYGKGAKFIVHEDSNIFHHFHYERGNVHKAFQESDFVFEDTFLFPSAQHYSMEPHASIASCERDRITVWSGVQMPFPLRREIARMFDVPLSRVQIIVPYMGGGFGGEKGYVTGILASVLSRMVHRPVRVAFSADDSFKTMSQPRARVKIKTGLKKDGTFIARQSEVQLIAGAYAHASSPTTEKMGHRVVGPYRFSDVLTDSYAVYTNTVPTTAFRGFGGPQVAFAYESHLDMMAHRMKMDPLELRLKNLLERGQEYNPGDRPMDCDLKKALQRVADEIGWGKKSAPDTSRNGKFRGKGIACTAKDAGGTNKLAYAMVKILNDGSIVLSSATVELGQGVHTAFLQIVAEELSVPPERIQVADIDTQYTPFDSGTNAISGISVMGQAVQKAARDAREQLLTAAASFLGVELKDVALIDGRIICGEMALSLPDFTRRYFTENQVEIIGRGFFRSPRREETVFGYPTVFWEVGIAATELEVDEMTGEIKILEYVSLADAGKMINPVLCRGQDEGSVVFGLGHTLHEELVYKDGRLMNPNLVDYRLPRFRDLPAIFKSIIIEEGGGPGPYGAKGMGEGGTVPVAAVICNAVYDAIGVRMSEVPLKGHRVWSAIQALKKKL